VIRFTDPVSGYSVDVQSYQWGYDDGTTYLQREFGRTSAGVLFREILDTTARPMTVTFEGDRTLAEALRTLSSLVMAYGGRVQFFPDTSDLGTYRWIDWQPDWTNAYVTDWRHRVKITLAEQAS